MKQFEKFLENSGLYGANAAYLEDLYESYLKDKSSVSEKWQEYFREYAKYSGGDIAHGPIRQSFEGLRRQPTQLEVDYSASEKQTAVLRLIAAYRRRGHQAADLCPLNLREREVISSLTLAHHGLTNADLDREFNIGALSSRPRKKLRDIVKIMENAYTRHIGVEYMHITNPDERHWIQNKLEVEGDPVEFSADEKRETLRQLVAAEGLERYLHVRYVGQKRFSLEGGDALIPMMHELIHCAAKKDAEEIVIGMAHRGRLNMLVNILGKSPQDLFAEFEGRPTFDKGSGDVKYHMGFSSTVDVDGRAVHLALSFNPSHLEVVNPVIVGSARARLERRLSEHKAGLPFNKVIPVQIHGDAAFAGQGVVMETMQLSEVRGYSCGGSVHIVINNQIGFTTSNPLDVRSATYCTDVAKMIQAPIFHVNGDDPEAVKTVIQLALAYRQTFNKDVVIDLVCYRRLGHNEADEPSATQPMMYEKINAHPVPSRIYADRLINEGVISEEEYKEYIRHYRRRLETEENVGFQPIERPAHDGYVKAWKHYLENKHLFGTEDAVLPDTTVSEEQILRLTKAMNEIPKGVALHPRVQRIHENRYKMGIGAMPMDWGFAEIMAYATLLDDGYPVRLSGQDSRRGTFFHRHAVYYNQKDGLCHIPLEHLREGQPKFTVIDSILSEFAVLGFEYGYATAEPNSLVIWEAQFGDFVNGAQVVIDQFIASGETKWRRLNGLVLLLPHGYEGQGPEHSSARPERFLELCAENNMSVVVPTTPAQAFHMFRRQMLQDYRKPLICMSPKSLLRHRQAISEIKDLTEGRFQPVIPEVEEIADEQVSSVVISVGKIYYDLVNERAAREDNKHALIRLEEIYPFPSRLLHEAVSKYSNATEIIFCQDEPRNQGYANFVRDYLEELFADRYQIRFVTRPAAAAPAVGYNSKHIEQQRALIEQVFQPAQ